MTTTNNLAYESPIGRHPSSFRDPAGGIFISEGRVIRGLRANGVNQYEEVKRSGLFNELEKAGKLIRSVEVANERIGDELFERLLEHDKLPFISYPYEWPFPLLKRAALFHLQTQLTSIARNVVLTDATAYNVQFRGIDPVFIDVLSFRPYQDGELWSAHKQFCEMFLNPLLLQSVLGVPYNAWYRGALEGIPTDALAKLLPFRSWLSLRSLLHVLLPARAAGGSKQKEADAVTKVRAARLPKEAYVGLIRQLYRWIEKLEPQGVNATVWENYSVDRTYQEQELSAKQQFIADYAKAVKPGQLWDMGCNDGEFGEIALQHGAQSVIGFDADLGALQKAFHRAEQRKLNFLPLYQDAANPSPNQGWLGCERQTIQERGKPDGVFALAFEHHLALGRNIPLCEVVRHLASIAPSGVIEFVQKSDSTVQRMLALKGDIFPDYSQANFEKFLAENARVVRSQAISAEGRKVYWFER